MGDRRPERFSPMPNRAWLDNRLSKLHLRVLGVIAMHARFGDNGLGCTLSSRRIGEKIEVRHDKVAMARRELVEWGYLDEHPHPTKKQMYMHFIIFDLDADADAISSKTGPAEVSGSDEKPDPYRGPVETQAGPILGSGSPETGPAEGSYKILTSKVREDIGLKPIEDIPLGRGVSPDGDPRDDDDSDPPIGAQLAVFERDMPGLFAECMPCETDIDVLKFHYEWLAKTADEYGAHQGDQIGGWAGRLSDEVLAHIYYLEGQMGNPFEQEQVFR